MVATTAHLELHIAASNHLLEERLGPSGAAERNAKP